MMNVKAYTHKEIGRAGWKLFKFLSNTAKAPKYSYICSHNHLLNVGKMDILELSLGLSSLRKLGLLVYRESKGVLFLRLLAGRNTLDQMGEALLARK